MTTTNLKPIGQGNPYYDDAFQNAIPKNYVKEMYWPERAIQSRELITQQTLSQYQISAMADYLFKDGSCINGGKIGINTRSFFMQGKEKDINGLIVDYDSLVGKIFIGSVSGQSIQCINVDAENRYIYFRYMGSDISDGENFVSTTTPFRHFSMVAESLNIGMSASNEAGIIYVDGYFINIESYNLTIYPWEGTVQEPIEWNIGYLLSKNIITSGEDSSLLDNAQGTYNYNAPGADRYQIQATLHAYKTGDEVPDNFIPGLIINNGVIIKDQITNTSFQYEDILAKRTYDESGSYSVNPWLIYNQEDSAVQTSEDQYTIAIQPGLGYIYGYEVSNIVSILLANERARTFKQNNEKRIYYSNGYYTYGAYDPASNTLSCNGLPNYANYELVELCSNVNGTGNVLGTCNVIEYARVNNKFLIYLDNVSSLLSIFPSVKSIRSQANPQVYVNLMMTPDNLAQIYGNTIPKIMETGYNVVRGVNSNSINYEITKTYSSLSEASGNTIILNELDRNLDFLTGTQNVVAIINALTGKSIYLGNLSAIPNNSGASSYLTLTSPDIENGVNYNVITKIGVTNLSSRIKLLKQTTFTYNSPANQDNITDTISLPMEDGYKLISVVQQNNIASGKPADVTSLIKFDNGQTDTLYDNIKLSGWKSSDILSNRATPNAATSFLITYQYYEHVGFGPFTVNSYVGLDNTNIFVNLGQDVYTQIYTYKGSNGNIFTLRDCLDFRIKRSDIGKTNVIFLNTNSEVRFLSTIYLPRVDLVWVSRDKTWGVTKGIPSESPELPETKDGTMNIAWLYHEPYTDDVKNKVKIVYFKNQRYTMEDIGKLASNVQTLTEAVALAQLERNALDQPVLDQNGYNLYKTGIFTDNFANFNNSNFQDELYSVTIDVIEKSLRCPFDLNHFNFELNSGTNFKQSDVTVTIDYTTSLYASNPYATSTVNIQELMFYVWEGTVKLTPSIDTWVDDLGDIIVGSSYIDTPEPQKYRSWTESYVNHGDRAMSNHLRAMGYLDAWGNLIGDRTSSGNFGQNIAEWGTGHGHGATFKVEETTEYEGSWQLQSITSTVPHEYQNQYMRQILVTYFISGMRPGVSFDGYFDTRPIAISNKIADANGNVTGTFRIPPNTPVGTKVVEFYDLKKTQYAAAQYTGNSKTVWRDITVSYIRVWNIISTTRKAQAIADYDPVAQTFYINEPEGIYIDSIEVYFATKDEVANVDCYIVETDNGYPTDDILPFAYKSLRPSEVNISSDATVKTIFKFDAPIYLYGETEYAFVLATSTYNYSVYQSVLGQRDLFTNELVQEQPYLGSLFKSQNGRTWTAYQEADLTFGINRCVFNINDTSNIVCNIKTDDNEKIPFEVATLTSIINTFLPAGTEVTYDYMFSDEFSWTPFNNSIDTFMTTLKHITDNDSVKIRINMSSTNASISPQIDLEQISAIFTNNVLIESDKYEDYPWFAGTYISNTVNLVNESQDILTILDAIKPNNAKLDVYFKINTMSTPFMKQASMGTGSENDNVLDYIGKTFQAYYYNAQTAQLEPKNKLIITGANVEDKKIYIRSIGNPDEFFDLVDPSNENIYNGLDTKYTAIYLINVMSDVNIDCPLWVDIPISGLTTLGNYVIHNNNIWKNIVQPVLPTYTPSELSIVWERVPAFKVVSSVQTEPNIEWRSMREVLEANTKLTSVDKENYFVEYRYEPEIQIESGFQNFATRIDMFCKDKINIPRVKSLRTLALLQGPRQ